ncbi:MAG TPA: GNAT family N-acetyltransferase [Anaerolineales bacterium]|nr:GNAT family N-acetyltransferase [Anaerolineales bacterium]
MVTSFEIRPANANDIPHLMALDHSCLSDYVWQLELRRESGQVSATFREVRLPRSVEVKYPRDPFALADQWMHRDMTLVAIHAGKPVAYICAVLDNRSALASVIDLVVASERRRKGAASELLTATQTWAAERGARRLILEMQSKNQAYIRLAQKFGYDFCGYNDQYYPTQDVALFFGRTVK